MAKDNHQDLHTAKSLSHNLHLPLPTVSKIVKKLQRSEILNSIQGPKGGYQLARPVQAISVAQVIESMEGPLAITQCSLEENQACMVIQWCEVKPHWVMINRVLQKALEGLTLDLLSSSGKQRTHWKEGLDRVWKGLFMAPSEKVEEG